MLQDFTEVGGSDFIYLPYPDRLNTNVQTLNSTTDNPEYYKISYPVIGGLSPDSTYIKSLKSIENTSTVIFDKREGVEKALALRSYENSPGRSIDEYGKFFGKSDLEQVRYFVTGSYDMNNLLGIENQVTVDGTDWFPYTLGSYWNCEDWETDRNKCFSDETSVGEIFIGDNSDLDLKRDCELELNFGNLDGKSILDSSGKGSKGVLIGDYNMKKIKQGQSMTRDSYIKIPKKKNNEDGVL